MYTFVRSAGTALAGVVLAATGLLAVLPATGAQAASAVAVATKAAPAAACTQTARGWICFLRYCDRYYCYYDCYPTLAARNRGDAPSTTHKETKVEGREPAKMITLP
ncbi:hypothetical protein [Streptosporangium lutulentum]|uniref:Uncharacterized protein n=1 Tax=Streptosporangium lutulentum TaxID=1461250 RepID=A0ABT9QSH3_9ACTN|nr:hypothetical protein [Streptosporangium lutulentum]MDP9849705.1 hypothetical protein [Streptosporangium lutulentum]